MRTRTGGFPLGFRHVGSDWTRETEVLIAWIKDNEIEVIDLKRDADVTVKPFVDAGLVIGSIDLPDDKGMISPDAGRRAEAIARNAEYVRTCSAWGPMNIFVCMLPEKPDLVRAENFRYMVESFGELVPVLEESSARMVVEGYPGPGALCCTPEGCRARRTRRPGSSPAGWRPARPT